MPLNQGTVSDIPDIANEALSYKTLIKEWGFKPWELDRLSAKDFQMVHLAEHAQAYIEQQAYDQGMGNDNISESHYDANASRRDAFQ